MRYKVNILVDLSQIKEDPELEQELYKEETPFRVAAIRDGKILEIKDIPIRKIKDISNIPVTIDFDYPSDQSPGVYIIIGPNLPGKEVLRSDVIRIWIPPKKSKVTLLT
jgi:hypothetical protein